MNTIFFTRILICCTIFLQMLKMTFCIRAADLPAGPSPKIPSKGKSPGAYPNFTVTSINWKMDASAADPEGNFRDDIKMTIERQGPLPWSLTEFGRGRYAPRLNVADIELSAANLGVIPFDISFSEAIYMWENDLDPWAANGAAWRPHPAKGVFLASIRKNGQQWNDGQGSFHAFLSTPIRGSGGEGYSMIDGGFGEGDVEVVIGKFGSASVGSVDTSNAWFPYDQGWIGGHVASPDSTEAEWFEEGFHHHDLPNDASEIIHWSSDFSFPVPPATIQLPNVDSRSSGMLFTLSVESEISTDLKSPNRFTAANPTSDGSGWEVVIRSDREVDHTFFPDTQLAFSFLYVPYDAERLIGGQVRGRDGNILNGRGNYSVQRLDSGRYEISIPGKSANDGMLILGVTGRSSEASSIVSRSFLSYEPTLEESFIVESRFFESEDSQPLEDSDFYFAWVDFGQPLSPPGFTSSIDPPSIISPKDRSIEEGTSTTFSPEVSGTEPFLFQWFKDGEAISEANDPSLLIEDATLKDAGQYVLEVINAGGKSSSQAAFLKVLAPPHFLSQPQSIDASTGDDVRFSVEVSGTPPLSFQWQKNGIDLTNETNDELLLQNVSLEDAGQYRVRVSNEVRSEFSISGRLAIRATITSPNILQHPSSVNVEAGEAVRFQVIAIGQSLIFQWFKNGEPISEANDATLQLSSVSNVDSGDYSVEVRNSGGSIRSEIATLTIDTPIDPPIDHLQILVQPISQLAVVGSDVTFSVSARGRGTLTYQWQLGSFNIPGARSSSFTIQNVQNIDAGIYRVIISDTFSSTTSESAGLTIIQASLTNPIFIDRISLDGNIINIQWQAEAGVVLQAKGSLSDSLWQDVPGTEGVGEIDQLALGEKAFFRLIRR